MMTKLIMLATAFVLGLAAAANAALITEWNFNGTSATTVPGGESAPLPSTGAGTASLVGGVTAASSFGSGTANGGSSDPITTTPANYGWQTTNFPAAGAADRTAGTKYQVSTVGYKDIQIEYDLRHSNTSSRYEQFQYSTDGSTFVNFGAPSSVTAANNNPNFAFRIVAAFAPGGNAYAASSATGAYATSGTWRFDMVQASGTVVPEPTAIALFAAGAMLLVAVRRRAC
jgi:hypothetical protein